jgi:hypothetical protein
MTSPGGWICGWTNREMQFPVLTNEFPVLVKKIPCSSSLREFACNALKLLGELT